MYVLCFEAALFFYYEFLLSHIALIQLTPREDECVLSAQEAFLLYFTFDILLLIQIATYKVLACSQDID